MGNSVSHGWYAEWAAMEGRSEDLEYHIRCGGPNVYRPRNASRTSLLHLAAGNGHKECVAVLLEYGEGLSSLQIIRNYTTRTLVVKIECFGLLF